MTPDEKRTYMRQWRERNAERCKAYRRSPFPANRLGGETRALRSFVNAIREVLDLDPLYERQRVPNVERFGARVFSFQEGWK